MYSLFIMVAQTSNKTGVIMDIIKRAGFFFYRSIPSRVLAGVIISVIVASTYYAAPLMAQTAADAPTILITGSNRGIGLEFTRQYAMKGWQVIATCRQPDAAVALKQLKAQYPNIEIEQLDVLDYGLVDALAAKYDGQPIDILLNNAAITGGMKNQIFGDLQYETFERVLRTNVIGPLKMAEAFFEHVANSDRKMIVNITSEAGSIATVRKGGAYFYRPSKAALNMAMKLLSVEAADRGIIVGLINPDMVATDMLEGADPATSSRLIYTPEESVTDMVRVITNLTPDQSGLFLSRSGEELPW